ncbi:MAG: hypothetical protein Ct9H300mP8_04480 [Gammaproteobacteria bacterium]|nr:MAG: hypothetical protein Ct9H300mP8_04480 [Gammaproteobacteria bacterium]
MTQINYLERAESVTPLVREYADLRNSNATCLDPLLRHSRVLDFTESRTTRLPRADTDPLTQMRVIEVVSEADGSAGWNLMIGIETFGLVAPAFGLLSRIDLGSSNDYGELDRGRRPSRTMRRRMERSGQWQFVSGIHNAQVFGATVRLYDNGATVDDGFHYAVVEEGDYEIVDTWNFSRTERPRARTTCESITCLSTTIASSNPWAVSANDRLNFDYRLEIVWRSTKSLSDSASPAPRSTHSLSSLLQRPLDLIAVPCVIGLLRNSR